MFKYMVVFKVALQKKELPVVECVLLNSSNKVNY